MIRGTAADLNGELLRISTSVDTRGGEVAATVGVDGPSAYGFHTVKSGSSYVAHRAHVGEVGGESLAIAAWRSSSLMLEEQEIYACEPRKQCL